MSEEKYLLRALELAGQSEEEVGCACVIVQNEKIIAEEINSQKFDQIAVNHAEIKAVITANKLTGSRNLQDATAYSSCEPCAMCITALSFAKVARVVYARSMAELFPDDPQSKLDIQEFTKHLNFVPKIEQLIV